MNGRKFLLVLTSTEMPMQISLFISLLGFVSSPLDSQNDKNKLHVLCIIHQRAESKHRFTLFFYLFFPQRKKQQAKCKYGLITAHNRKKCGDFEREKCRYNGQASKLSSINDIMFNQCGMLA